MAPAKERPATKTIATNREARHEYFVLEALETGVELKGTEVKSLRAGGVNLKDSWVDIEDGELLVKGMHISSLRPRQHLQSGPSAGAASAGPQNRDPASAPAVQAAGLYARAAFALLQAWPRQDGSRPVQGQKALRQACRRRQARCKALHRPGCEVQRQVSTKHLQLQAAWLHLQTPSFPRIASMRFIRGRKGFDGGSEAWAAGSSGGTAL